MAAYCCAAKHYASQPDENFWRCWQDDKAGMRAAGYHVEKTAGWLARLYRGQVNHWSAGAIVVAAITCHMPWKQHSVSDWERKVHELQMKLLAANSALRLKTIYAERLEILLRQRNERVDELNAKLEHAYFIHRRLEREAEHLSRIIATAPLRLFTPTS
jgi:hypothetical protein